MNILLADDSSDIRLVFQLAFKLKGHQTRLASNGQEAVEALQEEIESFDAIVLDIEMPVLNGLGALERIRQLPQGKDIPIIMFTANSALDYDQQAKNAGANLLVTKPIYPEELLRFLGWLVPSS